jgi:hypothetical protein
MKRLTEKKIRELIGNYENEFKDFWEEDKKQAIAYELAKDFIYQAKLDYEHFLNKNVNYFWKNIINKKDYMRACAIKETLQYIEDDILDYNQ